MNKKEPFLTGFSSHLFGSTKRSTQAIFQIKPVRKEYLVEKNQISFKRSVDQILSHSSNYKGHHRHRHKRQELHEKLLFIIASETLIIRKERHEPRARKRRPKNYQLLTQPRHQFKEIQHRSNYKKPA